jgi:hypothetical protein
VKRRNFYTRQVIIEHVIEHLVYRITFGDFDQPKLTNPLKGVEGFVEIREVYSSILKLDNLDRRLCAAWMRYSDEIELDGIEDNPS